MLDGQVHLRMLRSFCACPVLLHFGDPSLFWRMMGRRRKEPADRVEEAIEDQGYTSSQIVSLHGG